MIKLTSSQEEVYRYIKEGRYRSVRQAMEDLELSNPTIQYTIQLLKVAGLVKETSKLVATRKNI